MNESSGYEVNMGLRLLGIAALALPAAAAVRDAPVAPPPRPVVYYFPTTVGDKCVYRHRTWPSLFGPPRTEETTEVVTAVAQSGVGLRVAVGVERDGRVTPGRVVSVTGRTVLEFADGDGDDAIPYRLLDLPDDWLPGGTSDRPSQRVTGPEEVTGPAGTFRAVRIDRAYYIRSLHGWEWAYTAWYAPGVGLVKYKSRSEAGELLSFTTGKKK